MDPTFITPEWQREVYESDVFEQHRRCLDTDRKDLIIEARARNTSRTDEMIRVVTNTRLETSTGALDVLTPPNPGAKALVASIMAPILLVLGEWVGSGTRGTESRASLQNNQAGHAIPYDEPEKLSHLVKQFLASLTAPD